MSGSTSRRRDTESNTPSSVAIRTPKLAFDDSTGFRSVLVSAAVEIREDVAAELPHFRAIRDKYGVAVPDDEEHLRSLTEEGRVLLAFTSDGPPSAWTAWGLD